MAESRAVLALRVPIGGISPFNRARSGKETDRGSYCGDVPLVDRDNDRGGKLALPRLSTRVEVPGGEHSNVLGVENRLREAGEEFVRVL